MRRERRGRQEGVGGRRGGGGGGDVKRKEKEEFLCHIFHSHTHPPSSNRAECYLKIHQPRKAVRDCNKALAMNPLNLKARWRRSNAWQNIGMKYPAALDLL